jgi:hypothetical protein
MTRSAYVEKTELVAVLRSRELHARADWVDRELPGLVDTNKNSSLLKMLGVDPDAMSPVDAPSVDVPSVDVPSVDVPSVDAPPVDAPPGC